jgi:transmembrane sensor
MQSDRTNEIDPAAPITEQAAAWWILLNEGEPTASDHRAFAEWVKKSPERVEAFLQAARLTLALSSGKTRWPDTPVEDLIRAATDTRYDVARLPRTSDHGTSAESSSTFHGGRSTLTKAWRPGIAAMVVSAFAVIAISFYFNLRPQRFETAIGEQRSVVLGDGSLVTLNTASAVEVRITKDRRIVRLLTGEALFQVAHDVVRPFDVTTGDTTVRAVGTQFNVDRRATGTTVTVVEGRVAVLTKRESTLSTAQSNPLEAGEQLTPAPRGPRHIVRTDVAAAIAWTQRKLIFEHRRLGEVAAEFNRYNRQVIDISSDELRSQEVTGVFQANDPGSFLTFLARTPGVTVDISADNSRFIVTQQTGRAGAQDAKQ